MEYYTAIKRRRLNGIENIIKILFCKKQISKQCLVQYFCFLLRIFIVQYNIRKSVQKKQVDLT